MASELCLPPGFSGGAFWKHFFESIAYGFGAAVGFSLALVLFSAIRERVAVADVPVPFRGAAIGMVTAGLMSLAFMGFTGLVQF